MQTSDALKIIRAMAEGVDPATGEIFEEASPFQSPQVVRALYAAADALERRIKAENRTRKLPEKAGMAWSQQEEEQLGKGFDAGVGVGELAKRLKRTRGAVEARLEKLGKLQPQERRRQWGGQTPAS